MDLIRVLREQSGAGIMDCKRALEASDGDLERAHGILKEEGMEMRGFFSFGNRMR